jgi:thioredoxin reductase (NADPH)
MRIEEDVIIFGAGSAGLTSALYLARTKFKFAIFEKEMVGGKLNIITQIDNYPGFPSIDGFSLILNMKKQVEALGVKINKELIKGINKNEDGFEVVCENDTYQTKALIIATGSTTKKLGIVNEDKFVGKGISYCAVCDGFFYKNKEVLVFAHERKGYLEATYLSNLVSKLYLVSDKNEDDYEGNLANLKKMKNVEFLSPYKIKEFIGVDGLDAVKIENLETNEERTVNVSGCFPFTGDIPSNYLFNQLGLDQNRGFIKADFNMGTNVPGVFAAGDIVDKPLRQIVTACGDGATAATSAIKYLNKLKK